MMLEKRKKYDSRRHFTQHARVGFCDQHWETEETTSGVVLTRHFPRYLGVGRHMFAGPVASEPDVFSAGNDRLRWKSVRWEQSDVQQKDHLRRPTSAHKPGRFVFQESQKDRKKWCILILIFTSRPIVHRLKRPVCEINWMRTIELRQDLIPTSIASQHVMRIENLLVDDSKNIYATHEHKNDLGNANPTLRPPVFGLQKWLRTRGNHPYVSSQERDKNVDRVLAYIRRNFTTDYATKKTTWSTNFVVTDAVSAISRLDSKVKTSRWFDWSSCALIAANTRTSFLSCSNAGSFLPIKRFHHGSNA